MSDELRGDPDGVCQQTPSGDELERLLSQASPEDRAAISDMLNQGERKKQRREFVDYCCSDNLFGKEKPAQHHQLLCHYLQMVEQGQIDRLMIFMPPGSAKSTYTSVR